LEFKNPEHADILFGTLKKMKIRVFEFLEILFWKEISWSHPLCFGE